MLCHIIIGLLLAIPAHGGRKISAVNEGEKADLLEHFPNIQSDQMSVSGISAGAAVATQFHVAYSEYMRGSGTFAGVAYYCARNNLNRALTDCMRDGDYDVSTLIDQTYTYENQDNVAAVSNMQDDRVFIWTGEIDSIVNPNNVPLQVEYYEEFLPQENMLVVTHPDSEHAQPTIEYGNDCSHLGADYINRCDYDGAFEAINWIHGGGLVRPSGDVPLNGELKLFDQSEHFWISPPSMSSMDDEGYVYYPSGCLDKETPCGLHIVYHGCDQAKEELGDVFVTETGYLEVGELNNIIMLFPQAISSGIANPNGCFDWWGYNNLFYAQRDGNQVLATSRMLEKLLYGGEEPDECRRKYKI